jgi:hypothetical protein
VTYKDNIGNTNEYTIFDDARHAVDHLL